MQNYRGNTNDYMRRGNYGQGCGMNGRAGLVSAPSLSYGEKSACCEKDDVLEGMPLAMAYVPWQNWGNIYQTDKALIRGTIFAELDKPFCGKGGCNQ